MDNLQELSMELGKISWFKELKPELLQKLTAIAHLREIKNGETVFHEGDREDYLYIVIEGRIALDIFIPHRGKIRIYTAEPLDVFGWSSVTPTIHQRTASAVCVLDSKVIGINAEKLRKACDEDHDLGYAVMRRLANIVASRLLVTRLQLLDMFAQPETNNV
jgi:CRP/FNR family transcriptional regulator, cyclic AMP receptor protein